MAIVGRFGRPGSVRLAHCQATDLIGHFVYLVGTHGDGCDIVTIAEPSDINKMPAVGVIITKQSDTICRVQWDGETPSIFADLQPGKPYVLNSDGSPTRTPERLPGSSSMHIQHIGVATSSTKLYVKPQHQLAKRIFE